MARGEGRIGANVMNLAVGEQAKAQLLFQAMNRMSRKRGKRAWGAGKGGDHDAAEVRASSAEAKEGEGAGAAAHRGGVAGKLSIEDYTVC